MTLLFTEKRRIEEENEAANQEKQQMLQQDNQVFSAGESVTEFSTDVKLPAGSCTTGIPNGSCVTMVTKENNAVDVVDLTSAKESSPGMKGSGWLHLFLCITCEIS